jgi:hypothetical protein
LFIFANGLCILYLAGLEVIGTIEEAPHYTWWVASALFSLGCLCFIFLDAPCISHLDNDFSGLFIKPQQARDVSLCRCI